MPDLCRNVLVMGVCGVGKSTVAKRLSTAFSGHFVEADLFHTPENIRAMSEGIPLDDDARMAWLDRIGGAVSALNEAGDAPVFIACSALKLRYREHLRVRPGTCAVVFLNGDPQIIRLRMEARADHFMPPALLESQLRDLEPPPLSGESAVAQFDVSEDLDVLVEQAKSFCQTAFGATPQEQQGARMRSR